VDGIDEHDGEVTDYLGAPLNEDRFRAFGGDRYPDEITETTMHFTGQREEESLGIYFYNARYYDPMLGRFLQADSIVPNPLDPPSFDRYAYVRNSPVMFNDPSGHDLNCGVRGSNAAPEDCEEADPNYTGHVTPGYDYLDPEILTDAGKESYNIYKKLWGDKTGWWWSDPNLGGDGSFTVTDYISLLLILELSGKYVDSVYSSMYIEAMTRNFYTWSSEKERLYPGQYATSPSMLEAILNYTGEYIGNFRGGPGSFTKPMGVNVSIIIARSIISNIQNPSLGGHTDWAAGCINGAPCRVGSYTPGYPGQLDYIDAFISAGCEPSFRVFDTCSISVGFAFFLDLSDSITWDLWVAEHK
jgi:RHS repeat-associated protein